uniref:Uncharacterized protein n=1 Tax=Panagrolaimus sp. JU765 TaxID=591449 RepID=A0AC34RB90_9BILA
MGSADFPSSNYVKNIRQLTFGGHHTLPSFNFDGTQIVFTAKGGPYGMDCEQVYRLNLQDLTEKPARLSPGLGYATNAKYFPGNNEVIFESNFHKIAYPDDFTASKTCPISTCSRAGQDQTIGQLCTKPTWNLFANTDVFRFTEYGNIKDQLSNVPNNGYCGSGTVDTPSFDGQMLYYGQMDDLGINLYTKVLNQAVPPELITTEQKTAYYGGITVNGDGQRMAYHGRKPTDVDEIASLKQYLQNNLVPTTKMDIYVAGRDSLTSPQQIQQVQNYSNSFPSFANTNGNKVIFTTNYGQPTTNNYGLYLYNENDKTLQTLLKTTQFSIIHGSVSKDYNKIVFASNKDSNDPNIYQLYLADFNVTGSSPSDFDGGHYQVVKPEEIEKVDQTCWQNTPTNNLYDGVVHFPGEVH